MKTVTTHIATCAIFLVTLSASADLRLASDGATAYRVVRPERPTAIDDYAVKELTHFLSQKTEAEFPVISPEQYQAESTPRAPAIFVGLSEPSRKVLGTEDPLANLKDQEHVEKSVDENIVLYGKGMRGNLNAVVDFMENSLGRKWFSGRLITESPKWRNTTTKPTFTVERDLTIEPFSRKSGFSFKYRLPSYEWMFDFHTQNGMNIFMRNGACGRQSVNPRHFSLTRMPTKCHTVFSYIPPSPERQAHPKLFKWVENKNYFETNPEYFSLWDNGKRTPNKQLCFSNPELRRELTKNILEHIRLLKADGWKRLMLDLSAHDDVGAFCHCQECQKLEKKYQSPGGPFYDYLFELCRLVKEKHPDTMLHTLAYRLSQTQKPPVMPEGMTFPDNLTVQFANVEDASDVDWNHPKNHATYEDLLAWRKLTPHVWTWYYPFNGMIDRLATDIRLMKKADLEGVYMEFSGGYYNAAINFTELQIYIYNKLLQDVNRDVDELIREFTDSHYGAAAPEVRTYLKEMEAAWRASSSDTSLSAGRGMGRKLTGLTPATIRRWQEMFDRMMESTAGDARVQANLRRLRRGLDYRTLKEWNALTKAEPEYFSDHSVVMTRLGDSPWWMKEQVEDWEMIIQCAGKEKPLPAPFDKMDPALVNRFVPVRKRGAPARVPAPDAAFGYGAVVNLPDKPFQFGFYQNDTKTHGVQRELKPDEIENGAYHIYKLGEIQATPNCIVWFSARSWLTQLQLGERLYRPPGPNNDNRYDVYVSLKFDDPLKLTPQQIRQNNRHTYDPNEPYSVLCDQIIFVKKPVDK